MKDINQFTSDELDEIAKSKGFKDATNAIVCAETYRASYFLLLKKLKEINSISTVHQIDEQPLTLSKSDRAHLQVYNIDKGYLDLLKLLKTSVFNIDFEKANDGVGAVNIRIYNCFKYEDIETVYDLVKRKKTDLLRVRNFGKRCFAAVDYFLQTNGLNWEMNLSLYEFKEQII